MSIESVILSNHLVLCFPLLLLPSIFPSIKVFSNESALASGGQKLQLPHHFPMNIQSWFSLLISILSIPSKLIAPNISFQVYFLVTVFVKINISWILFFLKALHRTREELTKRGRLDVWERRIKDQIHYRKWGTRGFKWRHYFGLMYYLTSKFIFNKYLLITYYLLGPFQTQNKTVTITEWIPILMKLRV